MSFVAKIYLRLTKITFDEHQLYSRGKIFLVYNKGIVLIRIKIMMTNETTSRSAVVEKLYEKSIGLRPRKNDLGKIKKYFSALYDTKNNGIAYALTIAAHLECLLIVFDFECSTLEGTIRENGHIFYGKFNKNECLILIGARREQHLVMGTLIHELMHCVCNEVFRNDCLPYAKDDGLSKIYYKFLLEEYKDFESSSIKDNCKGIISNVYRCYESSHQKGQELIARAPQIIATFCGKRNKIAFLKEEYEKLFTFYNITITSEFKIFIQKYLRQN